MTWKGRSVAHWIFQGNPRYYHVTKAIEDLDEMDWLVTRYGAEIVPGDDVLVWVAGKQAGIYAQAIVTKSARKVEAQDDKAYWLKVPAKLSATLQCRVRFVRRLLDRPLLRSNLLADPVLKGLVSHSRSQCYQLPSHLRAMGAAPATSIMIGGTTTSASPS